MKESLFDILNSHPNWEADIMEPATNREACAALDREIRQAAAMYADSLLPLADRWQKAVEYDINQLFTTEPPHTHFNKDRQKRYKLTVDYFIGAVKQALKGHDFDVSQLDRVTQWRIGENLGGLPGSNTQTQDGLSRDEADKLLHKMRKQGYRVRYFRELCSNLYTVFAYKDEASQMMPQKSPQAALKPQPLPTTHQPQTNSVGRPIKDFAKTIADKYTTSDNDKVDTIQQYIGTALQSMTDPKAVIALLIECFENDILKQCPSYPQVLEIVGTVEAYCPFGKHQPYGIQRNIYFDKEEAYLSLNDTTNEQDNEISKYRLEAEKIVTDLLALLEPPTEPQKARHRTK